MKQNFLSWHVNEHIERISQNLRVTMDATLGYIKLAGNWIQIGVEPTIGHERSQETRKEKEKKNKPAVDRWHYFPQIES